MIFTPTADFFSEAFDSQYLAGLRYTVRPGNDRLAEAVAQWLDEGRVVLVQDMTGPSTAELGGAGNIGG